MSTATAPLPPCPQCAGEHLYGITFKHRTSCPLYERDSATTAADHERSSGIRDMTETEAVLTEGAFEDPPEGWELGVRFAHSSIHHRQVVYRQGRFTLPATPREASDE